MATKWLPNPYAMARLLSGSPDSDQIFRRGGKAADNFLREAFVTGRRPRTITEALALFERMAASFKEPVTFERAVHEMMPIYREQGYSVDEIARVLPSLVAITDAPRRQEFSDADQLVVEDVSYLDPVQGVVGNCYLISAMIALAWAKPDAVTEGLNAAAFNPPGGSFQWKFHQGLNTSQVAVTGRILMANGLPVNARSSDPVEDWPSLLEKAYVAHVRGSNLVNGEPTQGDYTSTDAKTTDTMPPAACKALLGGKRRARDLAQESARQILVDGTIGHPNGVMKWPVMAWTNEVENMRQPQTLAGVDPPETDADIWKETGLWPRHAYAVLGVMLNNNVVEHVVLRNPHGVSTDPNGRFGYLQGSWTPDGLPPVPLNEKGVFAISRDLFFANFRDIGWIVETAAPADS
jgi:hypothetical protein